MTTTPYTRIPNAILDAMQSMNELEAKLTAVLVRETYGRQCDETRMTWDQMQALTGLSRASVGRAMEMVELRGFFWRGRKSAWFTTIPGSSMDKNSSPRELNTDSNSSSGELFSESKSENSSRGELNGDSNSSRGELDDSSRGELSSYKEKKAPNGAKEKKGARGATPPPHPVWDLPKPLKTTDFEAAWIDWFKHCLESGRYLTQTRGDKVLAQLADIGAERAAAAIQHSINRGWVNIYEPDIPARASPNGRSPSATDELVPIGDGLY